MASYPIYQFYAELDDFKPKIWRRFQVAGNITAARLAYTLMVLFEMRASHLYSLSIPDERRTIYFRCPYDECESMPASKYWIMDADSIKLTGITSKPNTTFKFNYDFGDDWWVTLTLEEVFTDKDLPSGELPRVLEGEGFGIVEDVGGAHGLADLTMAFKSKKGADYRHFCEWLGIKDFDATAFDLDDMNYRLKKIPRIYKQSYENRMAPTQRSIDLIERKHLRKKRRAELTARNKRAT